MPEAYYYADDNSQPVGPLSLDEIRRFADAGVVPSDVMICEAGSEEWKPLSSFAEPSRTTSPSEESSGGSAAPHVDLDHTTGQPEEKQKDSIWTLLSLGLVAIFVIVKVLQSLKVIDF